MTGKLKDIPPDWDIEDDQSILETGAVSYIKFMGRKLFQEYEPTQFDIFENRLIDWLNNVDSKNDRQLMLYLLLNLFFVGRREFEALYRSIYSKIIAPWIIDLCELNIFSTKVDEELRQAIDESWICPITDSLRINSFLKVCGLKSMEYRPDWKSLEKFCDVEKVSGFIAKKEITRLILLEDFIGSGTQAMSVLKFIKANFPELNVLICPLIICPNGEEKIKNFTSQYKNFSYSAGISVPDSEILNLKEEVHETEETKKVRSFFQSLLPILGISSLKCMYGFKSTGSQIVMYSNCPNNTLQIYHHESKDWVPLFPRVIRRK
tara:strand:- start:261 stop:1223 length:963 start_codon:yes stop_codon:yes gene_type:complete